MAIEEVKGGNSRDLQERIGALIADANAAAGNAADRQVRNGVDDLIDAAARMGRTKQHVPLRPGEPPTPSNDEQLLTRAAEIQAARKGGPGAQSESPAARIVAELQQLAGDPDALSEVQAALLDAQVASDDDDWDTDAEPVVERYDYDKPSIEEGYEPVAGFRYPDHRTEDDWISAWSTESDVDTDVHEEEAVE